MKRKLKKEVNKLQCSWMLTGIIAAHAAVIRAQIKPWYTSVCAAHVNTPKEKVSKTETFGTPRQNEQPGAQWCERKKKQKSWQKFHLREKCHVIDRHPQWPKKLDACTQIYTPTLILITAVPLMFLRCLMTACCPEHVCGVFKVLQPIKIKALLPYFFSNRWVPGFIFFFFSVIFTQFFSSQRHLF